MNSLIIGDGEVGRSLFNVFFDNYPDPDTEIIGRHDEGGEYDKLHICFPYDKNFESEVKRYQEIHKPKYTIIHSTVPVGTSRKLNATHSPIRGKHPHLEEGIRTFTKFLGGEQASDLADYFRRCGLKVCLFDKQETTEALKLFDTEYYKVCIEFTQRVKRFCNKFDLNFSEVYTIPNQTYNDGYTKLGMPEVVRPVLQPIIKSVGEKQIGGHCVLENSVLLLKYEKEMDEKRNIKT